MTGHLGRRMTRRVTLPNRRVSSSPRLGLPNEIGIECLRLREDCLGDPVDGRISDVPARGEASHPQIQDRRIGDECCFASRLVRVPAEARDLTQPQMQHSRLRRPVSGDVFTSSSATGCSPKSSIATRILANIAPHAAFVWARPALPRPPIVAPHSASLKSGPRMERACVQPTSSTVAPSLSRRRTMFVTSPSKTRRMPPAGLTPMTT
jgi:hypothetical protein